MSAIPKTREIPAGSETAKLLYEADEESLILVVGATRYRVIREPAAQALPKPERADPWADYDPERALEGMMAAAGAITPEEGERWINDIYRWREEGSRRDDSR